jgi:hypothetical protein
MNELEILKQLLENLSAPNTNIEPNVNISLMKSLKVRRVHLGDDTQKIHYSD